MESATSPRVSYWKEKQTTSQPNSEFVKQDNAEDSRVKKGRGSSSFSLQKGCSWSNSPCDRICRQIMMKLFTQLTFVDIGDF